MTHPYSISHISTHGCSRCNSSCRGVNNPSGLNMKNWHLQKQAFAFIH
ncbi:hypothetical protein KP509_29G007800 [Ceratopteris richardii]|uniref:Uncharacterized protein n=1 Tax=Ceratopteris richardii TaxID=49495 RepID=A0A8T2R5H8_CERRI|nr:hypothetical protein KP509_29G007800 [Ceratopteris richardii]